MKRASEQQLTAPFLPPAMTMEWTIISNISESQPPYSAWPVTDETPVGSGKTHYSWKSKSMVEEYFDYCIPIWDTFPQGSVPAWSCTFVNGYDHKAYVITHPNGKAPPPEGFPTPCCLFAEEWYAPAPNFASLYMQYGQTSSIHQKPTDVWQMDAGALGGGEFYYEFYKDEQQSPASFAFPGTNGNYIIQYWKNVMRGEPNGEVFELPDECKGNPPPCPSPGGIPVSMVGPHSGQDKCIYPTPGSMGSFRHP
eukprot:TRINITY_DN12778_c0_g1_i1.p1 TRINITY_DN12778_c0_g1~~TRINITY_DN12778_c0_g1_i1.p1  ORF type:complete len:283 (+),score=42.16 TRINITY_DN12778_c0_g1_i1:94-849(+)